MAMVSSTVLEHPSRSRVVESIFDELKIRWSFEPDVPLHSLNAKSDHSQVRSGTHQEDVARYEAAYIEGKMFTALVARKRDRTLLDGFTRRSAAVVAKVASHAIYWAETSDSGVEEYLVNKINHSHGRRPSPEETQANARRLLAHGYSLERVADAVNEPLRIIRKWSGIEKLATRLRQATGLDAIKVDERLGTKACERLASLRNEPTLIATMELVNDAGLRSGEVQELVKRLNESKGQAEEQSIIAEEREVLTDRIQKQAIQPNGHYRQPLWMQTMGPLTLLTKYPAEDYVADIPEDQKWKVRSRWEEIARKAPGVISLIG